MSLGLKAQEQQQVPGRNPADAQAEVTDVDEKVLPAIRAQVEFVEVSHEQLVELLFTEGGANADASPLRKRLREMVREGKATMLDTTLANCRSGEKTKVESSGEFMYPTDYEPWDMSKEVDTPTERQGLSVSDRAGLAELVVPATPAKFETRNLGTSFEFEPKMGDNGKEVVLSFSAELAWHTGNTVWASRKDPAGNLCQIAMPDIYSMRIITELNCVSGQDNLAGVISPKNEKGETDTSRKVMVFVKCQVLEVK